jgi:hypothetical protein
VPQHESPLEEIKEAPASEEIIIRRKKKGGKNSKKTTDLREPVKLKDACKMEFSVQKLDEIFLSKEKVVKT